MEIRPYLLILMTLFLMVSRAAWAADVKPAKTPVYSTENLKNPVSRNPAWARQKPPMDAQAAAAKSATAVGPIQLVKPVDGELKRVPAFKGSSF